MSQVKAIIQLNSDSWFTKIALSEYSGTQLEVVLDKPIQQYGLRKELNPHLNKEE